MQTYSEVEKKTLVKRKLLELYSILFAAGDKPVSKSIIASAIQVPEGEVESVIKEFEDFLMDCSPLMLQQVDESYILATRPEYADIIRAGLGDVVKRRKLSAEAYETLAIIAYSQPIVKSEIDAIKGTDSEKTLTTLLKHELIKADVMGSKQGSPLVYRTTRKFLVTFGLRSLSELPAIEISR